MLYNANKPMNRIPRLAQILVSVLCLGLAGAAFADETKAQKREERLVFNLEPGAEFTVEEKHDYVVTADMTQGKYIQKGTRTVDWYMKVKEVTDEGTLIIRATVARFDIDDETTFNGKAFIPFENTDGRRPFEEMAYHAVRQSIEFKLEPTALPRMIPESREALHQYLYDSARMGAAKGTETMTLNQKVEFQDQKVKDFIKTGIIVPIRAMFKWLPRNAMPISALKPGTKWETHYPDLALSTIVTRQVTLVEKSDKGWSADITADVRPQEDVEMAYSGDHKGVIVVHPETGLAVEQKYTVNITGERADGSSHANSVEDTISITFDLTPKE